MSFELAPSMRRPLGRARLAQAVTVGWMLIEGVVAVGAGIVAHSLALTAFGLDSFIELFSAAVVLRRLLERSENEERGSRTIGERTASRLVGSALYLLIAYIVVSAAAGLLLKLHPKASPVGVGLTIASIAIMAVLWRWRLSLADRLGSPALRGDAACSVVCLYMAIATLAGLALNGLFGWWWADPIAGLAGSGAKRTKRWRRRPGKPLRKSVTSHGILRDGHGGEEKDQRSSRQAKAV